MCEVNFNDSSVPIDTDSESEQFSSLSSDTECDDSEVHIGWNLDKFNDFVNKKHWGNYCRDKYFTVILQIQDRCVHDAEIKHN